MLIYPHIDKVALALGPFKIHWYGLMYVVGFLGGGLFLLYRMRKSKGAWTDEQLYDVIFYGALGVILGGRLGYIFFYKFDWYWQNPEQILYVWQGGMSFHGGLIGVLISMACFARKYHKHFFDVTDFIAPAVPIGLAAGRLGNFINGELWGRPTNMPWGMVFERVGGGAMPRHPSQLYELVLEGVVLFILLSLYSVNPKPRAAVSGFFLIGYGAFRGFVELFREPDAHLNFVLFGWMTMGQLLCVPMLFFGAVLVIFGYRRGVLTSHPRQVE